MKLILAISDDGQEEFTFDGMPAQYVERSTEHTTIGHRDKEPQRSVHTLKGNFTVMSPDSEYIREVEVIIRQNFRKR